MTGIFQFTPLHFASKTCTPILLWKSILALPCTPLYNNSADGVPFLRKPKQNISGIPKFQGFYWNVAKQYKTYQSNELCRHLLKISSIGNLFFHLFVKRRLENKNLHKLNRGKTDWKRQNKHDLLTYIFIVIAITFFVVVKIVLFFS